MTDRLHQCDPHGHGGDLTAVRVNRLLLALCELDWSNPSLPPPMIATQDAAVLLSEIGECGECLWGLALRIAADLVRQTPDKAAAVNELQGSLTLLLDRLAAE